MPQFIRETPYANPLTGLSNDVIQGLLGYMKDKQRTQQMQGLASLLESTGIPKTVERAAYAESPTGLLNALTNVNRANVPLLKPETADALMNIAPLVAPATRAMMQATKGLPVGASIKNVGEDILSYRGSHKAPNAKTYGATLDDLTKILPADVYTQQGKQLYGIGDRIIDSEWRTAALKAKGKPDAEIEVYRAVPKGVKEINDGDWVSTSKKYAKDHGENTLNGEYDIISKKVKAKTLSTEGYPYEYGYNEVPNFPRQEELDTAQRNAALSIEQGGLGLPKDNTPEMRAKAMGIATDAYHGSKQDITGLFKAGYDDNLAFATQDPEFASKWIGKGKLNQRIGAEEEIKAAENLYRQNKYKNTDNALLEKLQGEEFNAAYDKMSAAARAENEREFGTRGNPTGLFDTVYPIKVQANKTFNPETDMDVMKEFFVANDIPEKLQDLYAGGNYMMYETKPVINYLKSKGYDSMRLRESTGDNYPTIAVFNPETVRSRFAAFDPFRRDTETALSKGVAPPDILAGVLPLGLLADEEQRKKLYELMPSLLGE